MKKTIIIAAIVLLAVSFVFANGSQEDSGKAPVLRVATMPLTAGVPVQYAADHGFFEEEGLNVQIDYYATGAPINEAIAAKVKENYEDLGIINDDTITLISKNKEKKDIKAMDIKLQNRAGRGTVVMVTGLDDEVVEANF